MDLNNYTKPDVLERYSFQWSLVRLLVAALALFIGGYPPVLAFNPFPFLYGPLSSLLNLAWLVSGAAAFYLLYRWKANGQKLFGGKEQKDTAAFLITVVSGINLGMTGLLGRNPGMSIISNRPVFLLVGLLYVASALHLYKRWNASGRKMF